MLKANYHTHTKYCNHAGGLASDYAESAIKNGFNVLGMSDHAPLPLPLKQPSDITFRNMYIEEFLDGYLVDAYNAKEKYKDKLTMYVGVETEYIKAYHKHYEFLRSKLDYMILGIHFFYIGDKRINTYGEINKSNIMEYAKVACEAMNTGLYDYFAHPDLFFIQYKNEDGNIVWDELCDKASRIMIECAIKNNVYLEINANGPNNSRRFGYSEDFNWLYPTSHFWSIVKEYPEAKCIIGSDAHNPDSLVTSDTPKIIEFVNKLGIKVEDYLKDYK